MADEKPVNAKRRIVKNPETFRERAIKANVEADKPTRKQKVVTTPARYIGRLIKALVKPFVLFGRLSIFRPLRRPLKFIGRILLPKYIRLSWIELRQVTWPNWTTSRRLTFAVLVFAIIFGVAIALVDWVLDKLFRGLLLK